MELKKSQINSYLERAIRKGYKATDFDAHVSDNNTGFIFKNSEFYFVFETIKSGPYADYSLKPYRATYSPGVNSAASSSDLRYLKEFEEVFDHWLDLIREELEAENRFNELNSDDTGFNFDEMNDGTPWSDDDQNKVVHYLGAVMTSLPEIGAPLECIEDIKRQNDLILKEIRTLKDDGKKIITKQFVVREVIGYLIIFGLSYIGTLGGTFFNDFIHLIFSKSSLLESVPPQSLSV